MKTKLLNRAGDLRTFAVVFAPGDEIHEGLLAFARADGVSAASIMVTETPAHLRRRMDPATGLPLIDLDA